jgi:hypothetical protein
MSTAPERLLEQGVAFEQRVAAALMRRGWAVAPFGLGMLPRGAARALSRRATPLRFLPDLIAWRGDDVQLVDAKSGWSGPAHRHDVNASSAFAAGQISDLANLPEWFVFEDGHAVQPDVILRRGTTGEHKGNGTGLPYLLIGCADCSHVDEVFGQPR